MIVKTKAPPKPPNYGLWWKTNSADENWYKEIFEHRPHAHTFFMDWFGNLVRDGEEISSIFEVGCGRGIPYASYFKSIDYYGADLSEKEVQYCREKYGLPADRFFVLDVIAQTPERTFDVVFSHAVIDHVYDINTFLAQLAKLTLHHLYISAYLNWFPRHMQHEYKWLEHVTCYHNAISPAEARMVLLDAGFSRVEIFPVFSGRWDIGHPMETTIIASR